MCKRSNKHCGSLRGTVTINDECLMNVLSYMEIGLKLRLVNTQFSRVVLCMIDFDHHGNLGDLFTKAVIGRRELFVEQLLRVERPYMPYLNETLCTVGQYKTLTATPVFYLLCYNVRLARMLMQHKLYDAEQNEQSMDSVKNVNPSCYTMWKELSMELTVKHEG